MNTIIITVMFLLYFAFATSSVCFIMKLHPRLVGMDSASHGRKYEPQHPGNRFARESASLTMSYVACAEPESSLNHPISKDMKTRSSNMFSKPQFRYISNEFHGLDNRNLSHNREVDLYELHRYREIKQVVDYLQRTDKNLVAKMRVYDEYMQKSSETSSISLQNIQADKLMQGWYDSD